MADAPPSNDDMVFVADTAPSDEGMGIVANAASSNDGMVFRAPLERRHGL